MHNVLHLQLGDVASRLTHRCFFFFSLLRVNQIESSFHPFVNEVSILRLTFFLLSSSSIRSRIILMQLN